MSIIRKVQLSKLTGMFLQGYVITTYDTLVELIGEPNAGRSGNGKVNCEWVLDIDGEPVTIYDWAQDEVPKETYNWHVGGYGIKSLVYLNRALGLDTYRWC